jgi:hypothetical protein
MEPERGVYREATVRYGVLKITNCLCFTSGRAASRTNKHR